MTIAPASIQHGVVYAKEGVYAGWPANHGHWQWGEELLVGFMAGPYAPPGAYAHRIALPHVKLQARSLDGGATWGVERPNVDFECLAPRGNERDLDGAILRVCGNYDTGGEHCHSAGGYYASWDRGRTWQGPFHFNGLSYMFSAPFWNTSRTCVLGNRIFLSRAFHDQWGTDEIFEARFSGTRFEVVNGAIGDLGRFVMPSVTVVDGVKHLTCRRQYRAYFSGLYRATPSGWEHVADICHQRGHNGNPPALSSTGDGQLVVAHADRGLGALIVSASPDGGQHWHVDQLRGGGSSDIGYPVLFRTGPSEFVCVYYFADESHAHQFIASTKFSLEPRM